MKNTLQSVSNDNSKFSGSTSGIDGDGLFPVGSSFEGLKTGVSLFCPITYYIISTTCIHMHVNGNCDMMHE